MMEWLSRFAWVLSTPFVVGLSAYLGKVWAGRILERDQAKHRTQIETLLADLRVRDDKELLVHRLQFEKEFAIYQELWRNARRLALACQGLSDLYQGQKSHSELSAELGEAHDTFLETTLSNHPFYAVAVYEAAQALRKLVVELHLSDRRVQRLEGRGQSDAIVEKLIELDEAKVGLLKEIPAALPSLSDAIRERIWSTRTTGWDRSQGRGP